MARDDTYPTAEQIKAQERKFHASRMEEEAQLRDVYGTPEDREHERTRVNQEWDKIDRDKAEGVNDDALWRNHLGRITRMATSLRDAKKATRRAKHFELAGLGTAAKIFQRQAEVLAGESKKDIDPQSDLLVDNLTKFNEFASTIEKYDARQTWEVWTQPSGKRVTKLPSGNIVPFEGGVVAQRDQAASGLATRAAPPAAATEPAALAAAKRKEGPLPAGNRFKFRKGANGKLTSGHFNKSEKELAREVRAYLSRQRSQSKYVMVRDMAEAQRKNANFRKYNSGIGQAETYAREYGSRGLGKKDDHGHNSQEKKFWLGMTLVMADTASEFARLRDDSAKKQEK
jgi:hypothetical protein